MSDECSNAYNEVLAKYDEISAISAIQWLSRCTGASNTNLIKAFTNTTKRRAFLRESQVDWIANV